MYILSDEVLKLGQHEGDWEYWEQTDKEIMSGHWIIEIEESKPARLYCDTVARKCFGISEHETPEMCYALWQENIFSSHIAEMQRHVNEIIMGARGDITYPWKSPAGNILYLRSIGIRDTRYQNGIRLVGTFQDVTNVIFSEQISRRTYLKSDYLLQILADTFEAVHVIQFDQGSVMPVRAILPLFWNANKLDIVRYLELMRKFIPPKDCELIRKCIIERKVFDNDGNCVTKHSWDFKSDSLKQDGCYNILLSLDPNVSKNDMILAVRDISELEKNKNAVSTLKHISEIDSLTKIFNRATIEKKIGKHIMDNPDEPGLVLLLDLDNFKRLNDVCGHIEGDNFLIKVAEKLKQFCRSTDIISRLGGDEFMIFMPNVKEHEIQPLVSRIISGIRKEYCKSGVTFEVTASVGIAHYPENGRFFLSFITVQTLHFMMQNETGKIVIRNIKVQLDNYQLKQ